MKKIFLSIIFVLVFSQVVFASISFSDVSKAHWAYSYIEKMQNSKVINGYPDKTFKPEDKVKVGEFIKMSSMSLWPNFKYTKPSSDTHWAMPYVESLNYIALKSKNYNSEKLEQKITRGEAVIILSKVFLQIREFENNPCSIDENETYIQKYKDIKNSTNAELRRALNICTQYGLINGFEDDTFRANEFLTRAQAAKIISLLVEK